MSEELDDLIARFGRWLRNTGFDGGVNSPPVKAHEALLRLRAENERLKAVVNAARVAAEELEYFVDFAVRQCEFEGDVVAGYAAVNAVRNALAQVAK